MTGVQTCALPISLGKPLIMGRKTFESIGKPLPGRATVLVTRDAGLQIPGVHVVHSFDEALAAADGLAGVMDAKEIMIAGGGEVYAALIGRADRLEITEVALEPEGDALFPFIDGAIWQEISREAHKAGPDDEADCAFVTYQRRARAMPVKGGKPARP